MRFRLLKLRGMGATFRETAELNIDALRGPLVAICGEIGAGKSVALECLMGAIDRTTPTRGRLGDLATARDSMVEVVVENGQDYTIRQTMDAVSGKGESLIMDADGEPVVKSGKRRDFDRWSSDHFPPANVRLASTFGAQKSEGFIDLKGAGRKDVILSVKGCDHFQGMSTRAGELGRTDAAELDSVMSGIGMLHGGESIPVIAAEIVRLEKCVGLTTSDADDTTKQLVAARVSHATHATQLARHEERTTKRRELDEGIRAKRAELELMRERIGNNEAVMGNAEAIREAVDATPKLEGQRATIAESTAAVTAALTGARDRRTEFRQQQQIQKTRLQQCSTDIAQAGTDLGDWFADLADATKQAPIEREAETAAAKEADGHDTEERRLTALMLNSKDNRIEALRGWLAGIVEGIWDDPPTQAGAALTDDDAAAKAAEEAPHLQADAGRAHRAALELMSQYGRRAETFERVKETLSVKIEATESHATQARENLETIRERLADIEPKLTAANEEIKEQSGVVAENTEATRKLIEELAKLEPLAKRAPNLERAAARLGELRPQLAALNTDIIAAREEVEQLGPPEAAPAAPPNIEELELAVKHARSVLDTDNEALTTARTKLARRNEDDANAAELEKRSRELEADLSDWRLLQHDLGRDGLQALEVDAAGPELTELANDLIHSCLGSRFSVRIDTTHKSADGKKEIEDCLVNVIDTERGHDGEVREFSGGERGLIGEAIDLALTMVSVSASGIKAPTIIRDERGASQSASSERTYIAMLRRAAEIIGAPHVLFVSHREGMGALADSRVTIKGGQFHVS